MDKIYVDYDTALAMQKLGFKPKSRWDGLCYAVRTTVREDIVEKYGGLSDDGFYDLTVRGGGDLQWEEVYDTSMKLDRPYGIGEEVYAPTVWEAFKYLIDEHKVFVRVDFLGDKKWEWYYITMSDGLKHRTALYYETYDDCVLDGVQTLIKSIEHQEEEINNGI